MPDSRKAIYLCGPIMGEVQGEAKRGREEAKRLLKEMIELPVQDPECFKRMGIRPARGVLLFGPPGTGKTLLAKAIATESGINFISIKGPEIMSKWVGESEKAIRQIFKKAKQVAPSIVFLDEIDSIAPRRGGETDSNVTERVVNQLLTSMDGIEGLDKVVVMAATNRPDIVDPALLRPGRFDRLILIPIPDGPARLTILKIYGKSMPLKGVDLEQLASRTDGFVGADIENLCREAAMIALRENREAAVVEGRHFDAALRAVKASSSKDTMKQYENFNKSFQKMQLRWEDPGVYR